jgi:hypothetical protein
MGNQVDEIATAEKVAPPPEDAAHHSGTMTSQQVDLSLWPLGWRVLARLARASFLRGFFIKLYNRLFQIYSQ